MLVFFLSFSSLVFFLRSSSSSSSSSGDLVIRALIIYTHVKREEQERVRKYEEISEIHTHARSSKDRYTEKDGGTTNTKQSTVGERYTDDKLKHDIRISNMTAAKKLADAIRTSLGPRGMDKMMVSEKNDVTITNDGATILSKMKATHPAAKMLWNCRNRKT